MLWWLKLYLKSEQVQVQVGKIWMYKKTGTKLFFFMEISGIGKTVYYWFLQIHIFTNSDFYVEFITTGKKSLDLITFRICC
jgi:hypothetical protein